MNYIIQTVACLVLVLGASPLFSANTEPALEESVSLSVEYRIIHEYFKMTCRMLLPAGEEVIAGRFILNCRKESGLGDIEAYPNYPLEVESISSERVTEEDVDAAEAMTTGLEMLESGELP